MFLLLTAHLKFPTWQLHYKNKIKTTVKHFIITAYSKTNIGPCKIKYLRAFALLNTTARVTTNLSDAINLFLVFASTFLITDNVNFGS